MTIKQLIQSTAFRDKMYRFARRILNDAVDAEDVCQDVLEKMWVKQSDLENHVNIEALSFKMIKEKSLDNLKHQKLKKEKLDDFNVENNVVSKEDEADLTQITKKLIAQLPQKQRMVMHLRDIEDKNFDEMQEILGMEESALRMNLSRARKTVREQLIKIMNHGL
jgi:RNA polymerase sigma-70 factor (ECF subfamily)